MSNPECRFLTIDIKAASNSQTNAKERRGAMMVLASLAKAKKEIISEKLNVLRNIGLSSAGRVIMLFLHKRSIRYYFYFA